MTELEQLSMLIGGKPTGAISGRTFESENPYTARPWAVIPDGGTEDVDAAVAAARAALDGEWGGMTGFARAARLRRLADLIGENAERLARLEVNDSGKNITTIEDPVEYVFPSINQIQINEAAGVTFAGGLRSILRQDPDMILVGEMRDVETARIAVQFLKGETPEAKTELYGSPSELFVPEVVTRENIKAVVFDTKIADPAKICTGVYAEGCKELGIQ